MALRHCRNVLPAKRIPMYRYHMYVCTYILAKHFSHAAIIHSSRIHPESNMDNASG